MTAGSGYTWVSCGSPAMAQYGLSLIGWTLCKAMRASRSSARQPAALTAESVYRHCPFMLSWKSVGLLSLAFTQLISFYLLVNLTGRQESINSHYPAHFRGEYHSGQQAPLSWVHWGNMGGDNHYVGGAERQPIAIATKRHPDNVLSVVRSDSVAAGPSAAGAGQCLQQTISAAKCSNEKRGLQRPRELMRDTCAYDLEASDVVFGVWHSLATEGRLQPLLDTWGAGSNIVLLASSVGARNSKLFKPGVPGSNPHLLDTGIPEDDYFSTLGKAFEGLRLMLEAYPTKKWFVVLGDDNYVLMDNYINVLSAFDPEQPWALSRMVFREKFGCKVAGGASVITSRAMTEELSPKLGPWYQGILERSGGDVKKATEADKFHDIAFQKLVENIGHSWTHLAELPHEPPGSYFDRHPPFTGPGIPKRSALFHYVPGGYMHFLHFLSSQACTCSISPEDMTSALAEVAVGVYSTGRRLSKLDDKRIAATWGRSLPNRRLLASSGAAADGDASSVPAGRGMRGDVRRIQELVEAFPEAGWYLLLPVNHYVVPENLAVRIRKLDERREEGARGLMISGPGVLRRSSEEQNNIGSVSDGALVEFEDGALLLGRDLAAMILEWRQGLSGGIFPTFRRPGDRDIYAWARTINRATVLEDSGFVRRLPRGRGPGDVVAGGCPAAFPLEPDLADLKPEFTMSEGDGVMMVSQFLLQAAPQRACVAT